jgi:hypothetical protein
MVVSKYDQQNRSNQRKNEMNSTTSDCLTLFLITEDLNEAAGIMMNGLTLGDFQYIQSTMRREPEKCKLVWEKLIILKDQSFRGIEFNLGFNMRRRFLRKLKKKFPDYHYNKWREIWYK